MSLIFKYIALLIPLSFLLSFTIARLVFRRAGLSLSKPARIIVYCMGSYLIMASMMSVLAIYEGGERQLVILVLGFPTILLSEFLDTTIYPWDKSAYSALVVFIMMVNAVVLGLMLRGVTLFISLVIGELNNSD